MRPEDFIDRVVDRKTFVDFLELLSEDWEESAAMESKTPSSPYGARALGWENGTIGDFLAAAVACARDHPVSEVPDPNENPWRNAAEIILSGKLYE